jgi:hypothetical protein
MEVAFTDTFDPERVTRLQQEWRILRF